MEPPNCQFLTRVYHPNIDDQGRICLDILKKPPKVSTKEGLNVLNASYFKWYLTKLIRYVYGRDRETGDQQ